MTWAKSYRSGTPWGGVSQAPCDSQCPTGDTATDLELCRQPSTLGWTAGLLFSVVFYLVTKDF